jgi:CRP-like cAMP-binding protein
MTISSVHHAGRTRVEGFARIGRAARTLLCLAGVVIIAVALRSGLYEYFHGGGRALRGLSESLMTADGFFFTDIMSVALLGLATTSSVMLGAVLGLYIPFPKKVLAGVLAFAAGSLIAALAIELGFEGASDLIRHGASVRGAWVSIAGGFAAGAVIYYVTSLFLDQKGAALRYPSRFLEYALDRKRQAVGERLALLSKADLLRHLPAEQIEPLLDRVQEREVKAGDIVFRTGDPGDALYIVARGVVEVLNGGDQRTLAELGEGQTFGEMALLSEGTRTATIRAKTDTRLLAIGKDDFDRLVAEDPVLDEQVRKLSHERAIANLRSGDVNPALWVQTARESVDRLSRSEEHRLLQEAKQGKGAGLAIVFGNILDTIPGCLVIGAKFAGFETLSFTLILGIFLGGIPEAAASASMLRKAGYSDRTIFLLWATVLAAGVVAAVAGKLFNGSESMAAVLAQAVAGGAILALVTHAMIPEALHKGGSGIVLPTVGGFLFALYLALGEAAPI